MAAVGRAAIGIDVGTSGLKGVVLAEDGTVVATALAAYPLLTPRPGWTEQEPEAWWQAAVEVLHALVEQAKGVEITGLGLAGQMHGSVFLDADDRVIRPALLWNDARTGEEVRLIEERVGREALRAITGNAASAGFQAPKLLWLKRHEPEAFARLRRLLLPKDFIRLRLTGSAFADIADASGTLLLDLAKRDWSPELLHALEVERAWLPELREGPELAGTVSAEGARATGLRPGLPVVAGGGDNAAAAIGAGAIAAGQGVVSLGTSGTIFVHSGTPIIDPSGALNAFADCVPGGYHVMGVILAAGGALRWYRDQVAAEQRDAAIASGRDPYDVILEQADQVPAGAEGLAFLPYLSGERSPHMDASARGAWIGLSLSHDRRHMARALIEGVGFALRDCAVRMAALGVQPQELVVVGGGARNAIWRRLLAAQLGARLVRLEAEEGPALGAAILALTGVGVFGDLAAAVRATVRRKGEPTRPEAALAATYADLHGRWAGLYPALKQGGAFG
jgi:xylulokinase